MPDTRVLLGVIGRPHGVRGLVRVTSHTDPPEAIAAYSPLFDDNGHQFALRWRGDGLAEVSKIVGGTTIRIADRLEAERLANRRLYVPRDSLPSPSNDEFYLADLVGLIAVNPAGEEFGTVVAVHDYGAGASLEIGGYADPLLVPFTRSAVPRVDIAGGRVTVAPPESVDALPDRSPPPLPLREGAGGRGPRKRDNFRSKGRVR